MKGLAGQQGLHGKIERFRQLSSKASKNMVELEPIHSDLEIEKLEAIEVGELDEAQEGGDSESDSRVALEVVGIGKEES